MLSSVLLWGVVWVCAVLWWRVRVRESRAHPLPPAMPGGLPIIGHLHKLIFSNLLDYLKAIDKCTMEAGGVMHMYIGHDIYYTISDPEDALRVANNCVERHFLYRFLHSWLGEGLITGSAVIWRRHRKLLHPVFGLPMIHGFLEVFNRQSRELLNSIDPYAGNGKANLTAHIKKTTFQTSCLTAFGEIDSIDNLQSKQYFKAFEKYLIMAVDRFQKVWLHNEILYKVLGRKNKGDELVKTLKKITNEVLIKNNSSSISGIKTDIADADIGCRSFLNGIRQQMEKEPLAEQKIREELDTTIAASFDTSYNFFINILVLIGSYPEIQEKMYEEIMLVVGPDRDVEKEDLQKLVYTDAVVKESLRFLPPVTVIARYIDKDVKLKKYTLRAGNQCLILLSAMLRHPCWGADAHQFRPERWLDAATLPKNASISAGFSIGRRSCIGRTYAMLSAKVSVAHVVRKYRLTADHTKMQFTFEGLIKPVAGHEIDLQRRN